MNEREEWVEVTDGTTQEGDRFSYEADPDTGVGIITSHKRRAPHAQHPSSRVADWLEDQARIATNSLHCGDNSLTIQRTHAWAAELEAAATALRFPAASERQRDYDHGYGVGYEHGMKEQEAEVERLRQRLGPRGLEVVVIDGAGHYVNEKVKAEIERLVSLVEDMRRCLVAARNRLNQRAAGYEDRGFSIFSGNILAEELRDHAEQIGQSIPSTNGARE